MTLQIPLKSTSDESAGRIEVRFAQPKDQPKITRFLHEHWRADHVFVTEPDLLRWQHAGPENSSELTFVLAIQHHQASAEIVGLLGFIPFRRFQPETSGSEISLAIWKVREDVGIPGLGLKLLKTIERRFQPSMIAAIGISAVVKPIYTVLGYTVGVLSQAALFSSRRAQHPVAMGTEDAWRKPLHNADGARLIELDQQDLVRHSKQINQLGEPVVPQKTASYLLERFLNHPFYCYDIRGIELAGTLKAIVVLRRVPVLACGTTATVMRMVDIVGDGDSIQHVGGSLQNLVDEGQCDYLDVVHHGLDETVLRRAGFIDRRQATNLILPNYFEPFVAKNIDIDFAFRLSKQFADRPVRLMRADSDQDRPNLGPLVRRQRIPA